MYKIIFQYIFFNRLTGIGLDLSWANEFINEPNRAAKKYSDEVVVTVLLISPPEKFSLKL
ncbi:MAG: hypothetical protein B6D37_03495 [Sphingobacteriales bacterium UTBCD1]|jgi:hypothetical protein|nr:MAG: hypothetical protein B6D37_03495 [Sphingobacteriales bacterium UTBCD1]